MSLPQKLFVAAMLFLFSVPGVSIAATTSTQSAAQIQQLQQQIMQLQTELNALEASSTQTITISSAPATLFVLPYGQYSTEADGLRITFSNIEKLNASPFIAATSTLAQPFGVFNLNYTGCADGSVCNSADYPTQTTELWPGESTGYLNYHIMLNTLGTSTAILTVTKQ